MPHDSPEDSLKVDAIRCHGVGPFSLSVGASECLCLSGASGSGKSLLLRSLADMEPHEGSVTWRGTSTTQLSGPEWRRRIGLLPAESAWWLDRICDHFPDGSAQELLPELALNADLWQAQVSETSTGERQRLALLRLLANQPEVLLLDEPTASLDRESTRRVEAYIKRYRERHAAPVVWVSHDPDQIARVADRHLHLNGELKEVT